MEINFIILEKLKDTRWVGFYVKKGIANHVIKYKGVSERIAILKLKIDSKTKLAIIQVYASQPKQKQRKERNFLGDLEKILEEEKIQIEKFKEVNFEKNQVKIN